MRRERFALALLSISVEPLYATLNPICFALCISLIQNASSISFFLQHVNMKWEGRKREVKQAESLKYQKFPVSLPVLMWLVIHRGLFIFLQVVKFD